LRLSPHAAPSDQLSIAANQALICAVVMDWVCVVDIAPAWVEVSDAMSVVLNP